MTPKTRPDSDLLPVTIPSRDDILELLKSQGQPCSAKQIAAALDVKTRDERTAMRRRLGAMVRDGQIIKTRRSGYGLVRHMDLVPGRVIGHPDGFGFLVPDKGGRDKGGKDIFLPAKVMRSLLHGDRAVVRVAGYNRQGKPEGALVEVLERANLQIVGRYFEDDGTGFVVPDNSRLHQDVYIASGDAGGARNGQYVVAAVTKHPSKHTQPIGRITEVIGDHAEPGLATDIAIRAYELPHEWPAEVQEETAGLKPGNASPDDKREDLRDLPFVTIDGEDARDFDDAVFCEKQDGGWRLMVAIADVSHYVRPGSGLDEESCSRGTSVYFPDRVLPMLPEILSNELCSLKPEVDRLCLACEMRIDKQGDIIGYRFMEGVIRSAARLTYTDVAAMLVDKDPARREQYRSLLPSLDRLYELYQLMHKARSRRGLLEFNTTEARLIFDEVGKVESITPLVRNDAHRLIEECMLAANTAAAAFLLESRIPVLYRVHEPPSQEKIKEVREFLGELGLTLKGGDEPTARDFAELLHSIRERPDRHLVEMVLLRSMQLAVYAEENLGHFGLAFEAYTHFTSPIRRYPDLLVHRAIRRRIGGGQKYPYDHDAMQELGVHCSMTERRADEATRSVVQRLKCEYLKEYVGDEFEGIITSVTGFGLFVELQELYVEGLVHVTSLPGDYYHHDPVHHRLTGERTGRVFRIGEALRVKVMRVDVDDKKIDFEPAEKGKSKQR